MILKHLKCILVLQYFIRFVATEIAAEKALPEPLNLSLTWESEFRIKLSWNAPKDLDASCKVNYMITTTIGEAMNCSWLPANQASDLQLYYGYLGPSHIAACSEYQYRDGQRTGCHLRGSFLQYDVYFKVNGTLDGLSVQNNFLVLPRYHVKPPAPKVKITEEGRNLILSWDPPDIGAVHCWNFILKYNKCQESLGKEIQLEHVPGKVSYDQRCQYRVKLKAVYTKWCGEGGSDWSEEEIYGTEIRFSPKIPPRTLTALLKSVRSGSSAIDHRSALQL
ncbi:interleukin-13 receptor subunit alpha-2-like isoform X2 [Oncorhynchus tshawytscha]|uniref:interleukin-13 receptor subunit alpha-2-like isoform X2 n=1 Tax=Oncorhynchus tshawytscha TaxID=74940 RepID=UPI001C3C7374|nr:interleukin-13 receptor subunit alpha-2-like isoform X2 [Oncorhynchus tshawytscha]